MPSLLMEELVEEILVRFPPDDPASLVRAALVCKPWCRLVSGIAFRRRFGEFHQHRRGPALLGVLYTTSTAGVNRHADDDTQVCCTKRARILREPKPMACFVPTAFFRRGPAHHAANSRLRYGWRAIDASHGRVLLRRSDPSLSYGRGLSVWDPVTDELRDLPEPSFKETRLGRSLSWTAAVACAATTSGNCDHLDCHRGPFLVIDLHSKAVLSSSGGGGAGAVLINNNSLRVSGFGFADGGATASSRFLFMRTSDGLYSMEINSNHARKIAANCCGDDDDVVPYISFCTPKLILLGIIGVAQGLSNTLFAGSFLAG